MNQWNYRVLMHTDGEYQLVEHYELDRDDDRNEIDTLWCEPHLTADSLPELTFALFAMLKAVDETRTNKRELLAIEDGPTPDIERTNGAISLPPPTGNVPAAKNVIERTSEVNDHSPLNVG